MLSKRKKKKKTLYVLKDQYMQDLNRNESLDKANMRVELIELWVKQIKSKRNKRERTIVRILRERYQNFSNAKVSTYTKYMECVWEFQTLHEQYLTFI